MKYSSLNVILAFWIILLCSAKIMNDYDNGNNNEAIVIPITSEVEIEFVEIK